MARDWLFTFLKTCADGFDDAGAHDRIENFRLENKGLTPDELIRRWVEHRLRETGVVYGTPLASEDTIAFHTTKGFAQRRAVFLAILQIEAELAMEIGCAVSHCTLGNIRILELLVCFALLCQQFRLAEQLHEWIPRIPVEGEPPRKLTKLSIKVGRALSRQTYLTGNPLLGLPIHNSFNYVDAKTLGRLAVAYFEHGRPDPVAVKRVLDFAAEEKELLIKAMLGLTLADRSLGVGSIRVVEEQIRSAKLPRRMRKELLRLVRGPVSPLAVAAAVKDDRARDFMLEQVILGAVLDGHFSEQEQGYIGDLAGWLEVSPESLAKREARVVEFYERHKAYLDLFTVGSAVRFYRQRMVGQLQKAIYENLNLIVSEIKGTGELAELLYRASLGEKLDKDERKKMGQQLLDILRTIPSLAIFSLPGGAFLLPLVFKVLPEGLKPRAFAERDRRREREGEKEIL